MKKENNNNKKKAVYFGMIFIIDSGIHIYIIIKIIP